MTLESIFFSIPMHFVFPTPLLVFISYFKRRLGFGLVLVLFCFFFSLRPLSVQFEPNWRKAAAFSFSERLPSDAGPRESGLSPALELLNCHKKEAFVTGNTALGSETETDCARKQTTGKKVQPQNSLGLQSSASHLFLKDKFPFFGVKSIR